MEVVAPGRWGIERQAIGELTRDLRQVWSRFRSCFRTTTRENSQTAWEYMRGLLTMDTPRTFAHISRRGHDPQDDGQRLPHFLSASPWSAMRVIQQVQDEIAATPDLPEGTVLRLDESAEAKAGPHRAGAGRQQNERLGNIEMSQVGTFLAVATATFWTWIEGELYVPEDWLHPSRTKERKRLGIPEDRVFQTKLQLGWQMIQRVRARGIRFSAVLCDDLSGRSSWLRPQLDEAGLLYLVDIPANTQVYLSPPVLAIPAPTSSGRGRKPTRHQVKASTAPVTVTQVAQGLPFTRYRLRPVERGVLDDPFACCRVWTLRDGQVAEEWLVVSCNRL